MNLLLTMPKYTLNFVSKCLRSDAIVMIQGLLHAKNKTIPLYSVQINETLPQTRVTWSTLTRRATIRFKNEQNLTCLSIH